MTEATGRHAALPGLAPEPVAILEGSLEPCEGIGHCDGPVEEVSLRYGPAGLVAR